MASHAEAWRVISTAGAVATALFALPSVVLAQDASASGGALGAPEAPVGEETEAPVSDTEAPASDGEAPASDGEAPASDGEAPASGGEAPVLDVGELEPDEPEAPRLREMSADRPDVTESPQSVDAGHFQVEMDFLVREDDAGETSWAFAVANLKLGLFDFADLQVVLRPIVSLPTPGGGVQALGFDDPTVRLKVNLFGNDGGDVALGVLGWVTIPAPGSVGGEWEAGLGLPFGASLPWELSLGAMIEGDIVRNQLDPGFHAEFLATLTIGRDIIGPLSFFIEGATRVSLDVGTPILATVNGGLLFAVHENLVFDAGAYVGVSDEAPDLVAFAGLTSRI